MQGAREQLLAQRKRAPKVFVNRASELARLRLLFEKASAGRVHVALITGIRGIGKSSLVHAFEPEVRATPAVVLWSSQIGPNHPLRLGAQSSAAFLAEFSSAHPLVLILDAPSADLVPVVETLARIARDEPNAGAVLAIVCVRTSARSAIERAIAKLDGVVHRIALQPFDRATSARFVKAFTDREWSAATLAQTFTSTEGVPARLRRAAMVLESEAKLDNAASMMRRYAESLLDSRERTDRTRAIDWQHRAQQLGEPRSSGGAPANVPVDAHPEAHATNVFRLNGRHWTLRFGAESARIPRRKGLAYLAVLLAYPRRAFPVLELIATATGQAVPHTPDAGAPLDATAKHAYRRRMTDLAIDLEDARKNHDEARAARDRIEMEWIGEEIEAAIGLHGRDRLVSSTAERARVTVTKAIRSAIEAIREVMPMLAAHLSDTIRTGHACTYDPSVDSVHTWAF